MSRTRTATVIGAGLAGLAAARALAEAGREVRVLDKGRSVGGRMATRRIGDAVLDHGAQFFTVRDDDFAATVDSWVSDGIVREWCRGFGPDRGRDDGHPRYVGAAGMNSVTKHMSTGLDIECGVLVFAILRNGPGWVVQIDDATTIECDDVVVTCPLPQTSALLHSGEVEMPAELRAIDYDRTLGLLAVLEGDAAVLPPPGGLQEAGDIFSFVGDNHAKGISPRPAVTFHANPRWSAEHFDDDPAVATDLLLAAAREHLDGRVVTEVQFKKWRFATPTTLWPERCWADPSGTLVTAGDAFAGPRVEGAVLSGRAAARMLLGG